MKNKKQFTLIELIIVIVVIGILAAMALPKFNGVVRDAKLSAMINDKEVLEKALTMYYQKNDTLPLLNENQELIVSNKSTGLTKIVLAEEVKSSDMDTIYTTLQETLKHYNDSEETLYRIDLSKLKDSLSKDIKYGHKKYDKDFYVYSTKTGNVYYYDYLVNGDGTIQHTEYDTLLKENELIEKNKSINLEGKEEIIDNENKEDDENNENEEVLNNKPIVKIANSLENINSETIIKWQYDFLDEDESPTKISFLLNDIEYDSFDKIPTKLKVGNYTIRFKAQDSKGLWSDEVVKTLKVTINLNNYINLKTMDLGENHSMKIGKDGNLYAWGDNEYGQLGIGNTTSQQTPQKVLLPNGVKPISVSSGIIHSMVIGDDGELYGWGYSGHGQIGLGTIGAYSMAKKISLPNNVKAISLIGGRYTSMIIGDDKNLYATGINKYGELGIGSTTTQNGFTKVSFPNGVTVKNVYLGYTHSMAIGNDGNLYAWGKNDYGQLGLGNLTNYTTPQKVTLPNGTKPKSVSIGIDFSIVITTNGAIYACGANASGQLGLADTLKRSYFTPIPTNGFIPTEILSGFNHSLCLANDGSIYGWGYNYYGQLGLGGNSNELSPAQLKSISGYKFKSIQTNGYSSLGILENGDIYTWGRNEYGQLGTGDKVDRKIPTKIILP